MGKKLRIVNIGISSFYDALTVQDCEAVQIDWRPPVKISDEMNRLVELTTVGELAAKIDEANEAAADMIIQADPAWVDVLPAGEVVEGLDDYVVTHSGPPIAIMLIMKLGHIMSVGADKVLLMKNDLNVDTAEVITTFVYNRGLLNGDYSYSAAVGLFVNVINLIMLLAVNKASKKLTETSLF